MDGPKGSNRTVFSSVNGRLWLTRTVHFGQKDSIEYDIGSRNKLEHSDAEMLPRILAAYYVVALAASLMKHSAVCYR